MAAALAHDVIDYCNSNGSAVYACSLDAEVALTAYRIVLCFKKYGVSYKIKFGEYGVYYKINFGETNVLVFHADRTNLLEW